MTEGTERGQRLGLAGMVGWVDSCRAAGVGEGRWVGCGCMRCNLDSKVAMMGLLEYETGGDALKSG